MSPGSGVAMHGVGEQAPVNEEIVESVKAVSLLFRVAAARDLAGQQDLSRCEDAEPVCQAISGNRLLLGVADGLGGYALGFDNRSGGQIAASTAIDAVVDYFRNSNPDAEADAEALTNLVFKQLRYLSETKLPPSRVRGTLGRHRLATTLAVAVVHPVRDSLVRRVECYWIGDSRIYFLGTNALRQLSRDDNLTGSDAFQSVLDPPPMSQFLAASMEREWRLNLCEFYLDCPGVLFLCSDGCYSEFENPWQFEAGLQQALEASESWHSWTECLRLRFADGCSDDVSCAVFPVGMENFSEFKRSRRSNASHGLLGRCMAADLTAEEVWSQIYQPVYETLPGRRPSDMADGSCNDVREETEATEPPRLQVRWSGASRPWELFLAWLLGFVLATILSGPIIFWARVFWNGFKSLWQNI